MSNIQSEIQKYNPSERIELFKLDYRSLYVAPLTDPTEGISHYTTGGTAVFFGGTAYVPTSMQADGFDRSSKGTLPTPTLTIVDVAGTLGALLDNASEVLKNKDLLGTIVTRVVTFRRFLDPESGGTEPNTSLPAEVYKIERKSKQSRDLLEFSLVSVLDMEGRLVPKRLILKDVCTFVYRTYDPSIITVPPYPFRSEGRDNDCPYTGTTHYFDPDGIETTIENDVCGHTFSDCLLRFPQPSQIPFRGFIGVSRVRS